jgi:hypothetical protein
MPRIPRMPTASQETTAVKALRLATSLTPIQRHLLVRAGTPRWLRLPAPWQPNPGRQLAVVRVLAMPDYAVLEPVATYDGAYQLTRLGELVAGIWLRDAIVGEYRLIR